MRDKVAGCLWSSISTMRKGCGMCFKLTVKVIGPLMVVAANFLFGCIAYGFLFYIIPEMSQGSALVFGMYVALGLFFLVNILFNYIACISTPPGSPPPCPDPVAKMGGKVTTNGDGVTYLQFPRCIEAKPAVSWRWCRHCKCVKPPRAHHDSITGTCVYDMDHYCPWMNNCVGRDNYRYFFLFLSYLFFGALWAISMTYRCMRIFVAVEGPYATTIPNVNLRNAATFSFTIALSAAFAVGILFIWHIYLVLTNQTTIEFYINMDEGQQAKERGEKFKNPFDRGWRKNLIRVFGDGPWYQYFFITVKKTSNPEFGLYPPEDALSMIHDNV